MTRFPVHTIETAPAESKQSLESVARNFGFVPNLMGVLAESPAAIQAYLAVSEIFGRSDLSPVERQVVLLTVSTENGCGYCVAAHTMAARMSQVPDDVISALRDGTRISNPRLGTLSEITRKIVRQRGWLSETDVAAFYDAGLSKRQILDVVVGITQKTLSNYVNHIAETPLDDAFRAAAWTKETPVIA